MSGALSEGPGGPGPGAAAGTVFRSELNPVDFLYRAAYLYPAKVAVAAGKRRYSYRELAERSWRLANALRSAGLVKGERVAAAPGARTQAAPSCAGRSPRITAPSLREHPARAAVPAPVPGPVRVSPGQVWQVPSSPRSIGAASREGFWLKKPEGLSQNDTTSTGMTGHSSMRVM